MSFSDVLGQVNLPIKCKSNHRRVTGHSTSSSSSCIIEDSRSRTNHQHKEARNGRYNNNTTTVLIIAALVTLLLVQYSNSIYTQSFVRSMTSMNSIDTAVQRNPTSVDAIIANTINVTTTTTTITPKEQVVVVANITTATLLPPPRRILIAQYTASTLQSSSSSSSFHSSSSTTNIYDQFLSITSHINAAYAIQWNHDFWMMHGIAFRGSSSSNSDPNSTTIRHEKDDKYYTIEKRVIHGHRQPLYNNNVSDTMNHYNNVPPSRSTYNKVAILELALNETEYDGLLLLDADAMMYDFSRNIADLLSFNTVLVAHKTNTSEGSHTGSINVGVTLWNLRHRITPYVMQRWKSHCLRRIMYHSNDKLDDDQAPLQYLLKHELDQNRRNKVVYAIENEFYYARGTFVRHFIRPAGSVWMNHNHTTSSDSSEAIRYMKMKRSAHEVCIKYNLSCNDLPT